MTATAASARVTVRMEFLRMVNPVDLLMGLHYMNRMITRCGLEDDQLVIEAT